MEKFKEKLAALRAEIDQANAKADEYKLAVKQLESDHIQKDHELHSLQQKVKTMEDQLGKTEMNLQIASTKQVFDIDIVCAVLTNGKTSFQEADLRVEELEKKTSKLELELEEAEKRNEEFKELYKAAKEEMEVLERELAGV